ncbi:MAG: ribosome assembly factor SBDS [Candidatus Hydrothermarchaeota archaeon]
MVTIDEAVIARLETHGEKFEVLVDPDKAAEIKKGKKYEPNEFLAVETIFKDAKKGDKASEEKMKLLFGTTDPIAIAEIIIKKGEIQLTTEQRRRIQAEKRQKIVSIIARNAINPQTNTPHPPKRIEKALEEAKVHIDPFKDAEEQIPAILKALRPIIPLRFEERTVAVKIPSKYTGSAYGVVKEFGKITKEEWLNDGSWVFLIKIPAGIQDEFYSKLNKLTKGEAQTKIIEKGSK